MSQSRVIPKRGLQSQYRNYSCENNSFVGVCSMTISNPWAAWEGRELQPYWLDMSQSTDFRAGWKSHGKEGTKGEEHWNRHVKSLQILCWPLSYTTSGRPEGGWQRKSNFWKLCPHTHTKKHMNVNSSFMHNHQNLKATEMSFNMYMDKQIVVYPYGIWYGILFTAKLKWN